MYCPKAMFVWIDWMLPYAVPGDRTVRRGADLRPGPASLQRDEEDHDEEREPEDDLGRRQRVVDLEPVVGRSQALDHRPVEVAELPREEAQREEDQIVDDPEVGEWELFIVYVNEISNRKFQVVASGPSGAQVAQVSAVSGLPRARAPAAAESRS